MPQAKRYLVSDTTIEALVPILLANPRGLLVSRDELSGWFGSFDRYASSGKASADAANWLSMFNAESITVDRKTGTPRTIHVPQAYVSVVGGIQPGILQRALGAEHRESGLAARFLLACPPRKPKKWTDADIDPKAVAKLASLFDRLYEFQPTEEADGQMQPVLVRLSPEAKQSWTAYFNAHSEEQASLTGDMSAAWSKLEEYAARLALVIHCTRCAANDASLNNPEIVDAVSMDAGITLAKWFKGEAWRVYCMFNESELERNRRLLIEWIGRKGGTVTARETQQGCRWLKGAGAAELALGGLVKDCCGSWQDAPTSPNGGRPTRVFVLSTLPAVYETPTTDMVQQGCVDVDIEDEPDVEISFDDSDHSDETDFPFGYNNLDDPDGELLFRVPRGLPD